MRNNQPVTNNEYVLRDEAAIISRTNHKGVITECNDEFVEISGYTLDELIGQAHNLIRHPDIPPAAFKDLWDTLKRGRPWVGIVKNRRKNGDFYWVKATVAPLPDGSGYSSVRIKPTRDEIQQAEALYRRINNGENIRLKEGAVVKTGFAAVADYFNRVSIANGILASALLASLFFIALPAIAHFFPTAQLALWTTSLLGCVTVAVSARLNIKSLGQRLRVAEDAVTSIATGDLIKPLPPAGNDEISNLIVKVAIMRNALHELIAAVRQNVEALYRSSSHLTHSADDTAQVSIEQSSAAAGMAAAIEQLSESVDVVEGNSRRALAITQDSAARSKQGGDIILAASQEMQNIAAAVKSTAETISGLKDTSHNISGIANVINEIADQTNLLALNAAIEAARAGEAGRGFAVVADEVRSLSERTAQSTQQISRMIAEIQAETDRAAREMNNSVERVNHGVDLANQAGVSISEISEGSRQIASAVDEISHELHEQATAAREIALKVEQIATSAENNSASAAHTADSAKGLQSISGHLQTLASRFRIS